MAWQENKMIVSLEKKKEQRKIFMHVDTQKHCCGCASNEPTCVLPCIKIFFILNLSILHSCCCVCWTYWKFSPSFCLKLEFYLSRAALKKICSIKHVSSILRHCKFGKIKNYLTMSINTGCCKSQSTREFCGCGKS